MKYVVLLLLLAACPPQERLVLISPKEAPQTRPEIRASCTLAEKKCSRCHDLERIKIANPRLVDWPAYVDKMRRQPSSGISSDDAVVILRCLEYVQKRELEHGA
jgi:hypothetical protein